MKLAEALSLRAQLTEKDQAEPDSTLSALQSLIYRINLTNTLTEVDGRSITALLAERDAQTMKVKTLGDALRVLTEREDRRLAH